jgi:16S rRNA (guanine966-N2)-methyltransferase
VDVFAGSGSVGIEALSRGAKEVLFVEQRSSPDAATAGAITGVAAEQRGRVLRADAYRWARQLDTPSEPVTVFSARRMPTSYAVATKYWS